MSYNENVRCDCCDRLYKRRELEKVRDVYATDDVKIVCERCARILDAALVEFRNVETRFLNKLKGINPYRSSALDSRQFWFTKPARWESVKSFFSKIKNWGTENEQ